MIASQLSILELPISSKKIVFSDWDGTLTLEEQVTPTVMEIFELLKQQQTELIIVSGRSLSWGHFLLTHFPVKAAIMEGGGVIQTRDELRDVKDQPLASSDQLAYLEKVTEELKFRFPGIPLSIDSFGRLTDRAIDLHPLRTLFPDWEQEIYDFLESKKIPYAVSNIHINIWGGYLSKYKGIMKYLEQYEPDFSLDNAIYFGDAPNDESVFKDFPRTVGVSNIERVWEKLKYKPKIKLEGEENRGPFGVLNYLKTEFF